MGRSMPGGDEGGDGLGFFPDDPGRGERDEPAGFRAADFHAVEVGIGTPDAGGDVGGGESAGGEGGGEFFPLAGL